MPERIVELDLGCYPEAAVSGEMLLENDHRTFLLFNAVTLNKATGLYLDAGKAIVEFERCIITKFGYPNDEAWSAMPRSSGLSYAGYEVIDSEWESELVRLNRFAFPKTNAFGLRHFLLLFHDSSFECLANGYSLTISADPIEKIVSDISLSLSKD